MSEPIDLRKGRVLGNGGPSPMDGVVPVQPVEAASINGVPTPILTAMFLVLIDIRDELVKLNGADPSVPPADDVDDGREPGNVTACKHCSHRLYAHGTIEGRGHCFGPEDCDCPGFEDRSA